MRDRGGADAEVIIVGGGPAGATLAALLAKDGRRVLLLERDIHPRDHVGESLTPSNNGVLHRLGVLPKMEELGFVHKQGVGWTAPRSGIWRYVAIRTADFPPPGAVQTYSYNVERDLFDAMLLRNAHLTGARILQGVNVQRVLFEDDRAVGVRVVVADGWDRELRAPFVVDASGRRCLIASQLGLKRKDGAYRQFSLWSWFTGLEPHPPGTEGMVFFHFLGLERAWAWHIPLQRGVHSIGVVTNKADFAASEMGNDAFFEGVVARNRTFAFVMRAAQRIRPWEVVGDYSYRTERFAGRGWLAVGDAYRFVDPIFSSGVDVALHSATFAHETLTRLLEGADEDPEMAAYEARVDAGVEVWYETTDMFYRLQQLFGRFALDKRYREDIARALQGNPYLPENLARARRLLDAMREAYEEVQADPDNLLRPWALTPEPTR